MKVLSKQKIAPLISKLSLQPFFQKLHLFALTGMNYGNANTLDHEYTGEKKAIEYVRKRIGDLKQIVIFDVGANIGNYAVLVSKLLKYPGLSVYAFEPSIHTFPALMENISGIQSVRPYRIGLGNTDETLNLFANYEGSGAATLYHNAFEHYNYNKNIKEEIQIQTLDGFCKEHSIATINLLKIDVEGHEFAVLEGGKEMIHAGKIQFIQFEFGPFHIYSKKFFKDFWDLLSPMYKIYRLISNGLYEIKSYNENLEIFRTANFLAELKN